jgi:YD repeat-containing protein
MKNLAKILLISISFFTSLSCMRDIKTNQPIKEPCLISELAAHFSNTLIERLTYNYDNQGRLVSRKSPKNEAETYAYTIHEITRINEYNNDDGSRKKVISHYQLDKVGRIITMITNLDTLMNIRQDYTYDTDGYLATQKTTYPNSSPVVIKSKYTFKDGNLILTENVQDLGADKTVFTTGSESAPANFHYLGQGIPDELTGPLKRYYGKTLKNLIVKITDPDLPTVYYTYKKDIQGNIIQVTNNDNTTGKEIESINFKYICDKTNIIPNVSSSGCVFRL